MFFSQERLDFSCAMFSPAGDLVANGPHVPMHLGSMQETVKYQVHYIINYSILRTECSSIWSVIIWVIKKFRRPGSGSQKSLIMSMIMERIGRHLVLLPISQNYDKIWERNQTLVPIFQKKKETQNNSTKCTTIAHANNVYCKGMTCQMSYYTVQLQAWEVHCPVSAQIRLMTTSLVWEFFL